MIPSEKSALLQYHWPDITLKMEYSQLDSHERSSVYFSYVTVFFSTCDPDIEQEFIRNVLLLDIVPQWLTFD